MRMGAARRGVKEEGGDEQGEHRGGAGAGPRPWCLKRELAPSTCTHFSLLVLLNTKDVYPETATALLRS